MHISNPIEAENDVLVLCLMAIYHIPGLKVKRLRGHFGTKIGCFTEGLCFYFYDMTSIYLIVVLRSSAKGAALALDALPRVLADGHQHVVGELEASRVA